MRKKWYELPENTVLFMVIDKNYEHALKYPVTVGDALYIFQDDYKEYTVNGLKKFYRETMKQEVE